LPEKPKNIFILALGKELKVVHHLPNQNIQTMINPSAFLLAVFLLIGLIEWYLRSKNTDKKYTGSLVMNLAIGAMDQIGALFNFGLLYFALSYAYDNFRIFEIKEAWYQWVLAVFAIDLLGYWYHRFSHRVNFLWAGHVTHHSSDRFNFSNGFRTSPFQGINRILFWPILPILGFSPAVLVITLKVSGLWDFVVHNEYVPKLRIAEYLIITPSLHRVHHGRNDLYIDKNYGSTFSIWDRLFGTYQEETEKVEYGIKSDYTDNNPFWAIGHHYHYLWKTMSATNRWKDKIKVWFMPPEWKPEDVVATEVPIQRIKVPVSIYLKYYAVFQLLFCTVGIILLLVYKDFFSNWTFYLCGFIGIINMANAAIVINENISRHFERNELIRISLEAGLILTTIMLDPKALLGYISVFLLISMLLIGGIYFNVIPPQKNSTTT
jgi:alkylglycerol monooxygenase